MLTDEEVASLGEHEILVSSKSEEPTIRRYIVLDSLRGVCACMVALLHFKTLGVISNSGFVNNSFLFVDFFFVLSGFVIAASYGQRLRDGFPFRKFMLLRLGRVYPLHAFMLLVFLAFEIFASFAAGLSDRTPFTGSYEPALLAYSFLMLHTFLGPDGLPWNGPSWSIAVEVWTYVVFGLLFRFAGRWMLPMAGAIIVAAPIYLLFVTDRYLNVFHDGALVRCLYGFALGVFAHWLISRQKAVSLSTIIFTLVEATAVIAVIWFVSVANAGPITLAAPWLFLAAILIFAREGGYISRFLKIAPMVFVGTLSFSIYMIHVFVQYRMFNVFSALGNVLNVPLIIKVDGVKYLGYSSAFADIMSLAMLVIVIALAWLSYEFVEEPGRKWSRRLLISPRSSDATAERAAPSF